MKKIKARFNSKCFETGKRIAKGEDMYYDYSSKKCYCMSSNAAMINETGILKNDEAANDAHYVAAQEDAYWDNMTGGYYSR